MAESEAARQATPVTANEIMIRLLQDISQACETRITQLARLPQAEPKDLTEDRDLTARQVADLLGVSVSYVYHNALTFPFVRRHGRAVRFSARGVEAYRRQQDVGRERDVPSV